VETVSIWDAQGKTSQQLRYYRFKLDNSHIISVEATDEAEAKSRAERNLKKSKIVESLGEDKRTIKDFINKDAQATAMVWTSPSADTWQSTFEGADGEIFFDKDIGTYDWKVVKGEEEDFGLEYTLGEAQKACYKAMMKMADK